MTDQLGDWSVDVNEDVAPDMVELSLSELGTEGVFAYVAYLPPSTAREMARGLISQADWIEDES